MTNWTEEFRKFLENKMDDRSTVRTCSYLVYPHFTNKDDEETMGTLKQRKNDLWNTFLNTLGAENKERFAGNNDLLEMAWSEFVVVERPNSLADLNDYEFMALQTLPAGARASLGHFPS